MERLRTFVCFWFPPSPLSKVKCGGLGLGGGLGKGDRDQSLILLLAYLANISILLYLLELVKKILVVVGNGG